MAGATLLLLSGLPGSGKSALADALGGELGWPVLSVDPIEAAIVAAGVPRSFETGVAAYAVACELAAHQLGLGLSCVGDAVNSLEQARRMWRAAAERGEARLVVVELVCSAAGVHRARLSGRGRRFHQLDEPSWQAVQDRGREWEPWPEPRLVLDTAATDLAALVAAVRTALTPG